MSKKENGYECETGYLYIEHAVSSCVSRDKCIKESATIFEENKTCVNGYGCTSIGGYLYQGENLEECVSAEKCRSKEGWHPYLEPGECLEADPAADGDLFQWEDGTYSCVGYPRSNHSYTSLIVYPGDPAQCVSRITYFFDMQNVY